MAYRSFIDEQGTFWEVWEVHPQNAERRHTGADRRRVRTSAGADADESWGDDPPVFDRRVMRDRRGAGASGSSDGGARGPRRIVLGAAMSQGWLAFESTGERRRLCPIPPDWSAATMSELAALCARASSARMRASRG